MNKKPLAFRREPPPIRRGDPWPGYVKPFVAVLQEHPDTWFQFRPGVAHDSSRVQSIKNALPGVIVTTRRWYRPKKKYSRPRTKTTKCDIFAVWPSVPGVRPDFGTFNAEDAAAMMVDLPPAHQQGERVGPDEFSWDDFQ